MTSNVSDSSSELKDGPAFRGHGSLISSITALKEQIQLERIMGIKGRVVKTAKKLESHIDGMIYATNIGDPSASGYKTCEIICLSGEIVKCMISGYSPRTADKDQEKNLEEVFSSSTKLPHIKKIPCYISWIFLQRNQRMTEDQSVVGKRCIYYEEHGNETLICSDSEEDKSEQEEEKYEFSEG